MGFKIYNLKQKSADWLEWRKRGIGGSDAPVLWHGQHWGRTVRDLWLEKTGQLGPKKTNFAMARGNRLEDVARKRYEQLMGWQVPPLCVADEEDQWLKGSLDGWCAKHQLVCEIKAPNRNDHLEALGGQVPSKYLPQVDHLILVTGARLGHYVSYSDYFPWEEQLAVVPVLPNRERLAELRARETVFQRLVEQRLDPAEHWPQQWTGLAS